MYWIGLALRIYRRLADSEELRQEFACLAFLFPEDSSTANLSK